MIDDLDLRHHVYTATVEGGRPPLSGKVAAALGVSRAEVLDGFQRLRAKRLLSIAALQVAERLGPGAKVVTLMADSGLKYLNTDVYRHPA